LPPIGLGSAQDPNFAPESSLGSVSSTAAHVASASTPSTPRPPMAPTAARWPGPGWPLAGLPARPPRSPCPPGHRGPPRSRAARPRSALRAASASPTCSPSYSCCGRSRRPAPPLRIDQLVNDAPQGGRGGSGGEDVKGTHQSVPRRRLLHHHSPVCPPGVQPADGNSVNTVVASTLCRASARSSSWKTSVSTLCTARASTR
jgi:hypothetical protein